jgi:hypothetical protein
MKIRENMNKYPLIGSSIIVAVLIVLGSFNNIVGYQTIQASNQKIITNELNEKDLLFQTIIDMANNKNIQRVILGSELTGKRFFDPGMRFSVFTPPVFTKRFLNFAYQMGVILSKIISKSKMHTLLEQHPVSNQGVQKEITSIIEKDAELKGEMTQLSLLNCPCCETGFFWHFPIICAILYVLLIVVLTLPQIPYWSGTMEGIIQVIASMLGCKWYL